jgi:two-component system response regulator PilR (NtrC family)
MPTVLVVDDDLDFREALQEALLTHGCAVRVAGDADEACAAVAAGGIDVVVSDVRMPGDGSRLAKRLQVALADPPPVILMTAFDEPGTRERVLREGAFAYLPKPVSLAWLHRVIESALSRPTA